MSDSDWTELGGKLKATCLEENASLAGGDLVKAMMAKIDTDSDEKITSDELKTYLTSVGMDAGLSEGLITCADNDNDGSIDAFEFETILTKCGVL